MEKLNLLIEYPVSLQTVITANVPYEKKKRQISIDFFPLQVGIACPEVDNRIAILICLPPEVALELPQLSEQEFSSWI